MSNENRTACRNCTQAEQAFIEALQTAQQLHAKAQALAVTLAAAAHQREAATVNFTQFHNEFEQIKTDLSELAVTYKASKADFDDIVKLAERLHPSAVKATNAEDARGLGQDQERAALEAYEPVAAAAHAADEVVGVKQFAEAQACAGFDLPNVRMSKGCSSTGMTGFYIGNKIVNLHCQVGDDGSWALVHVSLSNAVNADNLYPAAGENYPGLASNADEWASLSEADMHDLWFSTENSVMKVSTAEGTGTYTGSLPDEHYIQRVGSADFSPFRAVRYVPEWGSAGSEYKICSNSASCYSAGTRAVTHNGRHMKHWETRYLELANGTQIPTSMHGIPGDVTRGCQWLYHFPESQCPNGQTAAYCNGQCDNACRNCLVVSKIFLAADDLATAA